MSVAVAQSVAGVDFAGMCLLSMFMYRYVAALIV